MTERSEKRCVVVLRSFRLLHLDKHVVEKVDARQDTLTLIEFADMFHRIVVKVILNRVDVVIEHESVNQKRTDLSEKHRRYVCRALCRQEKEDTLLTAFSCKMKNTNG